MVCVTTRKESALMARQPLCRLRDPKTRDYLHLSGAGVTPSADYAWSGTRKQAAALRRRADACGWPWPFVIMEDEA